MRQLGKYMEIYIIQFSLSIIAMLRYGKFFLALLNLDNFGLFY